MIKPVGQPSLAGGSLALGTFAIALLAIVLAGCAQFRGRSETSDLVQGSVATSAEIPPIDTATPHRIETATFALG